MDYVEKHDASRSEAVLRYSNALRLRHQHAPNDNANKILAF